MDITTGSRQSFAVRPSTALRLLLASVLVVVLAGLSTVLATRHASAGAVGIETVNSTSNSDDGVCNGPPNDHAVGNCTLREAINDVNNGFADTIKFHPAVFSKSNPGVIDLETAGGNLPIITREVTIDNTGTAVILDCDAQNDQTWSCSWGLRVDVSHSAFDFTLIGGKQFTIREINGDGIAFNGDTGGTCMAPGTLCSLGNVHITGVNINVNDLDVGPADGGNGIAMYDVANMNDLVIDNSIIFGDDDNSGDDAIQLNVVGNNNNYLTNNNVAITNNQIYGGEGVDLNFDGDLYSPAGLGGTGHTIIADASHNQSITGDVGEAVHMKYCSNDGGDCNARDSVIHFSTNANGKLSGGNDGGIGVEYDIVATETGCTPQCNDNVTAITDVKDNAIIDGADSDGVNVDVNICCATSDSHSTTNITGNSDIVGDADGVNIDIVVNEGPKNLAEVHVDDNGEITGEGDNGVDIEVLAGSNVLGDTDSDENTALVTVNGNQDISGDNNDGIEITAKSGKLGGPGDGDRNSTTVEVMDNGNVDGNGDGVEVTAQAGTESGPGDADDNSTSVKVNGNGTIDGSDEDGVRIDATAGHTADSAVLNVTGDGNATDSQVDGNGVILGHDGNGVIIISRAGGLADNGQENSTNAAVTNNDNITGMQGGGDGIEIDSEVCCDASNTNGVDISGNNKIIGQDDDGIDIDQLCCSVNTVTISDNTGVIKGNDQNGIEVTPCLISGDPNDPTSIDFTPTPLSDLPCMGDSVTFLIITGNNVSDSGLDGIIVCCGAFQYPVNTGAIGKSLIADNTISHNGEDGVDLDTTIGMNVEHNDIFLNGTSNTDGDNGVEIDWQFAYEIAVPTCNGPFGCIKVPAHFNRISENSIYDNVGLGINLIGIVTEPVFSQEPGAGTEYPGWDGADGVGCTQYEFTPIAANDCIPYPKILFQGGPTVSTVNGTACASCVVEVFIADDTPQDQTGPLGRQHGEGRTFLVAGNADGLGNFTANLPCGQSAGILTATATDKLKNTSEFSANIPFPGTPACAAATALPADTPVPATNTPVPPPNTPVPPTATAAPAGLCGDVNSDGQVNAVDATLILQKAAGLIGSLPKGDSSGDVNGDGVTNSIDATLILQNAASMTGPGGLSC